MKKHVKFIICDAENLIFYVLFRDNSENKRKSGHRRQIRREFLRAFFGYLKNST